MDDVLLELLPEGIEEPLLLFIVDVAFELVICDELLFVDAARDELLLLEPPKADDTELPEPTPDDDMLELPSEELVLFELLLPIDEPFELVLLRVGLFVLLLSEELFVPAEVVLLVELSLFEAPYDGVLLDPVEYAFVVELLRGELLLVAVALFVLFAPMVEVLPLESLLWTDDVVLYSLSELVPPLFDQPDPLADSSEEEDELRPPLLPLLTDTTLTCVALRESIPSSEESLLKLIPFEFRPVLPVARVRLALRLEGLMVELLILDLRLFSCLSSMTLKPIPEFNLEMADVLFGLIVPLLLFWLQGSLSNSPMLRGIA